MRRSSKILAGALIACLVCRPAFAADQLVVLGQYVGAEPLHFQLRGNYLGKKRTFRFTFAVDKATTKNAFVPRLWASRKIAVLIDGIRALGADTGSGRPDPATDPKLKELVDSIVQLYKEFGILTEYTAFLAKEGTNLSDSTELLAEAQRNFDRRAISTRPGIASVNQDDNRRRMRYQDQVNIRNDYMDEKMQRVSNLRVQQMNDRAFYRRGNTWVDSRVADRAGKPDRVIKIGSEEHKKLAERLAKENRSGTVSLDGKILLEVDNAAVLVE